MLKTTFIKGTVAPLLRCIKASYRGIRSEHRGLIHTTSRSLHSSRCGNRLIEFRHFCRPFCTSGKDKGTENIEESTGAPTNEKKNESDAPVIGTDTTKEVSIGEDAVPNSEITPSSTTYVEAAGTNVQTAVRNVASTIQFYEQKYEELEQNVMQRLHESNQRRFRIILLSSILFIAWITAVFGTRIRKAFTEQTAGLAMETLENESLKVQTQELATAVVNTILEDKEITSQAATFLKEASTAPETQQALLKLTLYVLQHKDTLEEVTKLAQKLIKNLSQDEATIADFSALLEHVLADPQIKQALVAVVSDLCQDAEVMQAVTKLTLKVLETKEVNEATTALLSASTGEVMQDVEVLQQSRQFVAEVMGDDVLQKEGGNALWKSISYALKPGLIRVTGATLVVASVTLAKVMLSPY
mmetsp:Transcript_8771/g.14587  ORF Transcript_8771/g.14587 Transcript_8771/m.14587 type:complete len:415 (-) Transcript_8771:175-1419(-)